MTLDEIWAEANKDERVASVLKVIEKNVGGAIVTNKQRLILAQAIVIEILQERENKNDIGVERTEDSCGEIRAAR